MKRVRTKRQRKRKKREVEGKELGRVHETYWPERMLDRHMISIIYRIAQRHLKNKSQLTQTCTD